MISDLKSLVHPLAETEFLALLRERRLRFLPGHGSRRFESLLNWETLNYLLDSATLPLNALRVMRESVSISTNLYLKHDRLDPAALSKLLNQGVSLIFNRLEDYVPALCALSKNLRRKTSEAVKAVAVMTSGRGGALECHFDTEDVVALQIAGTKRWQVFDSPVVNPVPGMAQSPPEGLISVFDQVMRPGDFLFLPAGHWHHCENGPHRSLHLSLLFEPPNGRNLMTAMVSDLSSDETFKRPLTRHSNSATQAEHETALRARLVGAIEAISLDRFLSERAVLNSVEGVQLEGPRRGAASET